MDGVLDAEPVVEAFWKTFDFTIRYFLENKAVNWEWYYPYADAPLVSDIIKYTETNVEGGELNYTITDQLQFIMPKSSLRKARKFVKYPDELHSETRNPWMKRHDWEMKPRISLPWPNALQTRIFLL